MYIASAELNEEEVLGVMDYAYYAWVGVLFLIGLIMFRKGKIHYGEDLASKLENRSEVTFGLFGLLCFFIYILVIPGTLVPSLKLIFTQGDSALYFAQLIGQILGACTLVAFAYVCPGSLHFAPSAYHDSTPPPAVKTFLEDIKLAWQTFDPRNLWTHFFSLCAVAISADLIWKLFYYISEKSGQLLPEDTQPVVDLIAKYDWSGPLSPMILLLITCVIGAPLIEELVFRGMIYPSLKKWLPRGYAIILTGVFFGVIHGNLAAVFPLMAFGSVLCIIRDRFGLFTCIAIHALFNLHTFIWLYLAPNAAGQL